VHNWVKGKKRNVVFLVCTAKACKRSRVYLHTFLTLVLDGSELLISRRGLLISEKDASEYEGAPGTN